MSDVRIQSRVVIQERLGETTYRATLPNGKEILAFTRERDGIPDLNPGDPYTVLLSLCNFNEGRLVPDDYTGIKISHPVIRGDVD